MMAMILEALATFGFLFVLAIIGGIAVIALALVWAILEDKSNKKKGINRYYKGHRRG